MTLSDSPVGMDEDTAPADRQQAAHFSENSLENASSKRRSQNRSSQRAYRLRQATTIQSLSQQVSKLEKTVEGMSTTLIDLFDQLLVRGTFVYDTSLSALFQEALRECLRHLQSLDQISDSLEPESQTSMVDGALGNAYVTSESTPHFSHGVTHSSPNSEIVGVQWRDMSVREVRLRYSPTDIFSPDHLTFLTGRSLKSLTLSIDQNFEQIPWESTFGRAKNVSIPRPSTPHLPINSVQTSFSHYIQQMTQRKRMQTLDNQSQLFFKSQTHLGNSLIAPDVAHQSSDRKLSKQYLLDENRAEFGGQFNVGEVSPIHSSDLYRDQTRLHLASQEDKLFRNYDIPQIRNRDLAQSAQQTSIELSYFSFLTLKLPCHTVKSQDVPKTGDQREDLETSYQGNSTTQGFAQSPLL